MRNQHFGVGVFFGAPCTGLYYSRKSHDACGTCYNLHPFITVSVGYSNCIQVLELPMVLI